MVFGVMRSEDEDEDEVVSLRRQLKEALMRNAELESSNAGLRELVDHWTVMHTRLGDAVSRVILKTDRYTDAMLDHSAHQRSNPAGIDPNGELLAKISDGSAAAFIDVARALRTALGIL